MKKSFILLIVCVLAVLSHAQQRSEAEALMIAQEFLQAETMQLSVVDNGSVQAHLRAKRISRPAQTDYTGYYIINDNEHDCFIIVSADERMYRILGYSDHGLFSIEDAPDGLLEMLDGYNEQYAYLLEHNDTTFDSLTSTINYTINDTQNDVIAPLIQSEWGQDRPFNGQCPQNPRYTNDSLCVSGCVATAMAQVMNYYRFPQTGYDIYSYRSSTLNILQSIDFNALNIQWDSLSNRYNTPTTNGQKDEVAKLMHACGVAVSMDYGNNGNASSAYACDIPYALIHHFGYNPNIVYYKKQYFSNDEWVQLIMAELRANRPILYSGHGSGGHQFILDGYDGRGLYHFNFGWTLNSLSLTGVGNGYYSIDAIIPTYLGVELGNYSLNQDMICQISPYTVGQREDMFYASRFSISKTSNINIGSSVYMYCYPQCYSSETTYIGHSGANFSGEIGIGVFDTAFNFISSLTSKQCTCRATKINVISENISLPASTFHEGEQYMIAPYAKSNSATTPTLVRTENGASDYYLAQVSSGKIDLVLKGKPTNDNNPPIENVTKINEGTYKVSAVTGNTELMEWQINLLRDISDTTKYWFCEWDTIAKANGYSYADGWNKVYGFAANNGAQIIIPAGQTIGNDLYVNNYSGTDDITVYISDADSTMIINDVWGTLSRNMNSETPSQEEKSRYTTTTYKHLSNNNIGELVSTPVIQVVNNVAKITCFTDNVIIYYTLDGETPSISSTLYSDSLVLTENCIIKAIAYKGTYASAVSQYAVKTFVVSKPNISSADNMITITCETSGASIRYTLDGSIPSSSSTLYSEAVQVEGSVVVKAIATKNNYTTSEMAVYIHNNSTNNLVINNLVAGDLENRIAAESVSFSGLKISGNLNGTDIAYIRDLIKDNGLTDLDISNCRIVSGGNPYYTSYSSAYHTKTDTIGKYMFYNCDGLISLSLPQSCSVIETNAIYLCENLVNLQLPASCEKIEMMGVGYCQNLSGLHLPAAMSSFDATNIRQCPNLRTLTVDAQNQRYKSVNNVLYSHNLDTIVKYLPGNTALCDTCPNGVLVIGRYAYEGAQFEQLVLPESLTEIGVSAFENCKQLKSIVIPSAVETIGLSAFINCNSLKDVILSDGMRKIETLVFGYCINLETIHITRNISDINSTAFASCYSLKEFTVAEENTTFSSIDGVLYSKNAEKLIRCPLALYAELFYVQDGTKEIANNAFNKCMHIESFYLPEGLEKIGTSAFEECRMKAIHIPESVNTIGMMAFMNCDSLESLAIPTNVTNLELMLGAYNSRLAYIQMPANVTNVGLSVFANCPKLTMIHSKIVDINGVVFKESYGGTVEAFKNIPDTCIWRVPQGTSQQYKTQPWWVSTWRIVEDIDTSTENVTQELSIALYPGQILVNSSVATEIQVYTLSGMLYTTIHTSGHECVAISLPAGVYIINGNKLVLLR